MKRRLRAYLLCLLCTAAPALAENPCGIGAAGLSARVEQMHLQQIEKFKDNPDLLVLPACWPTARLSASACTRRLPASVRRTSWNSF